MQAQLLQRPSTRLWNLQDSQAHQSVRNGALSVGNHHVSTLQSHERLHKRASETHVVEKRQAWELHDWRRGDSRSVSSSSTGVERHASLVALTVPSREPEEEILLPLPIDVENPADDPSIHNPLERSERMSTSWFGVVMEYDGVVVEDTSDLQRKAWLKVAELEKKSPPPMFLLKRAEGMKNDQVVKEVFCWTREPMEVRRICQRKEDVLTEIIGDMKPLIPDSLPRFMDSLRSNKVPAVLTSSAPESRIKPAIQSLGLENYFEGIVSGEDTLRGRPDPEPYLLAAQMMKRPHARCVVVGNSNQSVEAAKECGMAVVVVAGNKPVYELTAADLVVKDLGELRLINLQQLFRNEDLVAPQEKEPQKQSDLEDEDDFYEDTSLW